MAVTPYRVELLGPNGEAFKVLTLFCANDDEAIDTTGDLVHPHAMVLWQGFRHVADFPPAKAPAPPPPLN